MEAIELGQGICRVYDFLRCGLEIDHEIRYLDKNTIIYPKCQHDCSDRPLCRGYIMDFVSKYFRLIFHVNELKLISMYSTRTIKLRFRKRVPA